MIYVIRAGQNGPLKIGYAINPQKRLRQLQTANSEQLRILKIVPGERRSEKRVHRDLASFQKVGEWFEATDEVLAYVEKLGVADYEVDDGKPFWCFGGKQREVQRIHARFAVKNTLTGFPTDIGHHTASPGTR